MNRPAGVARLVALHARTGWRALVGWPAAGALLVVALARAQVGLHPTLHDRLVYAATLGASTPTIALNGRGYDLHTIGGIATYEVGFLGQLLVPFIAVHLVLAHTRREEESGRLELLAATPLAPTLAGAVVVATSLTLFGGLTAAGLIAVGLPAAGSAWYAAGLTALLAFVAGLSLVAARLVQSTRTGYWLALGALLGMYLLRALVDGMGGRGWSRAWAGPLGWLPELRPFGDVSPWPLAAYLALAAAGLALAVWIAARTDLGAGVIAPRPGPAQASDRLTTPAGLAWRLVAPGALGWAVAAVAWSALFGALAPEMTRLVDANAGIIAALGLTDADDLVTGTSMLLVGVAACAAAAQAGGRLGAEERAGRLAALAAGRVPRPRIWLAWWAIAVAAGLAVLAAGASTLGVGAWWSTGSRGPLESAAGTGAAYAAAVVAAAALAMALDALRPGLAALAWVAVGWACLTGLLADSLDLPGWARDLSLLHAIRPGVAAQTRPGVIVGLLVVGALLVALAGRRHSRRDLAA